MVLAISKFLKILGCQASIFKTFYSITATFFSHSRSENFCKQNTISFSGTFDHFNKIETLQLAHNNIKNMSSLMTHGLKTLKDIDLSDNNIDKIEPEGAFSYLIGLRLLNLEENALEQV